MYLIIEDFFLSFIWWFNVLFSRLEKRERGGDNVMKNSILLNMVLVIVLALSFFSIHTVANTSSYETTDAGPEYDPWRDLNDDGIINIYDVVMVTGIYGSTGTPINKTELLLGLQSRVEALEARIPKNGYISIHPGAFRDSVINQSSSGHFRVNEGVLRGNGTYYANVQLPNGSRVVNMTVYVYDLSEEYYVDVKLGRFQVMGGGPQTMASVTTYPPEIGPGYMVLHNDTITGAEIHNQHCTYYLELYFSGEYPFLVFIATIIEYEYLK